MYFKSLALFLRLVSAIPLSDSFNTGLSAAKNSTSLQDTATIDINALRNKFQNFPWIKTSFMTCTSAETLNDTNAFSFPISCVLKTQPKSDVTVFFEAFGAKISACFITFPMNAYNTAQIVSIIPSLNLFPSAAPVALTIYAVASANIDDFSNQVYYWTVNILNRAPAVCNIVGDPHIQTFDKIDNSMNSGVDAFKTDNLDRWHTPSHFTFKNIGTYILIKSTRGLMVVGTYTKCWGASCLSSITVQYGQGMHIVTIDPNSFTFIVKKSGNLAGIHVTPYNGATTQMIFTLDDGSTITISSGQSIIFTAIMAPVHYQKVSGHCNFWDSSIAANTLVSRNAPNSINDNSDKVISAWGESWAVNVPLNSLVDSVLNVVAPFGQPALFQVQPTYCVIPKMDILNSITANDVAIIIAAAQAKASSATKSMQDAQATQSYIAASILSYNNAQATATSIKNAQATQSNIAASILSYNNAQATATSIKNAQATQSNIAASILSYNNAQATATSIQNAQAVATSLLNAQITASKLFGKAPISTSIISTQVVQPTPSSQCSITRPQAYEYCKSAIQEVSECKSLCTLTSYLETCTQDILSSCGYYIVPSHRSAYLQICGSKATYLVNHTNPIYADIGHQITVNIVEKKCAASCPSGMSGTYCNVNLDSLFPGTSSLPQSVDVNAMNYVYKSNDLVQQVYEQKGNLTVKMSNKSNDTPLANNLSGSVMGRVGKAFSLLSMSILLFV